MTYANRNSKNSSERTSSKTEREPWLMKKNPAEKRWLMNEHGMQTSGRWTGWLFLFWFEREENIQGLARFTCPDNFWLNPILMQGGAGSHGSAMKEDLDHPCQEAQLQDTAKKVTLRFTPPFLCFDRTEWLCQFTGLILRVEVNGGD